MSTSCGDSNIKKSYIIQSAESLDIFSACTQLYTNQILPCTGNTVNVNGNISVLGNVSGTTFYGDGSNLTGVSSQDNYVSGGTYIDGTKLISFSGTNSATTFSVSLSAISSSIDIHNTYFVSPTGDDNTAVRGDLHSPFKTITAARNQAHSEITGGTVTGDTLIHVYPGLYVESEIQYENGNFYFEPGAIVEAIRNASANNIFSVGGALSVQPNIYSATTCNVYGYGNFIISASTANGLGGTVFQATNDSNVTFEFDTIWSEKGYGINIQGNTTAYIKGNSIEVVYNDYPITIRDNSTTYVDVKKIIAPLNSFTSGLFYRNGQTSGFNGKSYVNIDEVVAQSVRQAINFNYVGEDAEIIINAKNIRHNAPSTTQLITNVAQSGGKITINGNLDTTGTGIVNASNSGGVIEINGDIKSNVNSIYSYSNSTNQLLRYNGNILASATTTSLNIDAGTFRLDGSFDGSNSVTNAIDVASGVDFTIGNFTIENVTTNSIIGTGSVNILNNLYIDQPLTVSKNGQYTFTGTTYDGDLNIYNTPTTVNTNTDILTRNSSTGDVEIRDVSSIIGAASANTFVTGFTYDGVNKHTIELNNGSAYTTTMTTFSATSVSADTFYGDGSNLTGISTQDTYTTGGTYNPSTDIITITNNTGGTFTITGVTDTYITGLTFNTSTYNLNADLNDGSSTAAVSLSVLASDVYVLSGVYNPATGIVTYTNSTGGTFDVTGFTTGMTDSYTVAANLNGNSIEFDNNIQGTNYYSVDLLPLLSGKTDVSLFNSHTGDTTIHYTKNSINLSDLGSSAHTHTLSEIIDFNTYSGSVQTQLDTKVDNGSNVGSGTGIFRDKTGTTLNFKTLTSSGGTVFITNNNDEVNLEVQHTVDTNTFVTGYTYTPSANTFTIFDNLGSAYTATINSVSGLTTTGTFEAGTFTSGGTNLDQIFTQQAFKTISTAGQSNVVADQIHDTLTLSGINIDIITNPSTDTITFSAATEVGEVNDATNVGSGTGIYRDKTGTTINLRSITSSGGTVIISNNDDEVNLEVIHTVDTNTFVTGTTKEGNAAVVTRNDDVDVLTLSGGSNVTIVSGGTNLMRIDVSVPADTNTFVTGGTIGADGQLVLEKNNGVDVQDIDFTTTKRLVITADQALAISAGRSYLANTGVSLLSFFNSPASADDEASFNFSVPTDYVTGGTFYLKITSLASTPPNNEIQYEMNITSIDLNGDLSTVTDTGIQNVTSASTTSWELVESPAYNPITATFSANKHVSVKINRDVSDAPDTYAGTAYVWGLVFEYTGIR